MILYFAADLFWASKIKGSADALGLPCRPVRTLEMLEARLADSPVRSLLVDLDNPETAMALIRRMRSPGAGEKERGVRVVAFGPHVAKELFQTAKAAGADEVLTRGALEHNMNEVLSKLASG